METLTREALMRKTLPDLRHQMLRLGGYSPPTETRDSVINRLLLFSPQNWKPELKIERKSLPAVTEEELQKVLMPYKLRGLRVEVKDGCWHVEIKDRKESGNLSMPLNAIERTIKYLMPKDD